MLFNSLQFGLFFLAVFIIAWQIAGNLRLRNAFLTIVSAIFYMCWDPLYILLIILSSGIDYVAALVMERPGTTDDRRKTCLIASVVSNLGILFFFKYWGFAGSAVEDLSTFLGLQMNFPDLNVLLPVGISFYTFQSMSYTIDVYRRRIAAERSFMSFFMYVAFFPQLVAGPIVRARDFLPQIWKTPRLNAEQTGQALFLILVGLGKKMIISDLLAVNFVDRVFDFPSTYSSLELLIGLYAYALQIYCDFSGYSDIAIGTARLLGFWLPDNFNLPYQSRSISEFWRRWHMSLSSWLRDYLYFPLGGSKGSNFATCRNLVITMFLAGLWHGAAWTFVVWGLMHGLWMVLERLLGTNKTDSPDCHPGAVERFASWFLCFHFVLFTWIFFRSPDFSVAMDYLAGLGRLDFGLGSVDWQVFALLGVGYLGHLLPAGLIQTVRIRFTLLPAPAQVIVSFICLAVFANLASTDVVPFIYFQF